MKELDRKTALVTGGTQRHSCAAQRLPCFSHPEFREEVSEITSRIMAAFPTEAAAPRRIATEDIRRRAKSQAEAAVAELSRSSHVRN